MFVGISQAYQKCDLRPLDSRVSQLDFVLPCSMLFYVAQARISGFSGVTHNVGPNISVQRRSREHTLKLSVEIPIIFQTFPNLSIHITIRAPASTF